LAVSAWWIVLSNESRELAQRNLVVSLEKLRDAQGELANTERLATIGQITATVSHELRNPLGALTTSVAVLKRSEGKAGPGWQGELDRIQRNVERCARIIEDLLQFSRRPHPDMAPLAIDSWIELHCAELRELSPVPVELDLRSGRVIQADGERLRQALVNLVQNAMQAIGEQPSREGKVVLSTENRGNVVCLSVTDNGIGMTEEIRARVFEPLFSTKTFGVGLGMAHVARIIQRHSGTITVTSEPGEGSRVEVKLPASDLEDAANG
jgi:signal transduction histidine kinase